MRSKANALLCCLLLAAIATQARAQDAPPPATTPDSAAVDLSSPRATVKTFFEAMSAVQAGSKTDLARALDCLYYDEARPLEEQREEQETVAGKLFDIFSRLQFTMSSVPETVAGNDFTEIE